MEIFLEQKCRHDGSRNNAKECKNGKILLNF
jgi:hypothetical protein